MSDASTVGMLLRLRKGVTNLFQIRTTRLFFILSFFAMAVPAHTFAESAFSPTVELTVIGPYGVGAGVGTFYDMPDKVPYVSGIWGSVALLRSDEEGLFEDYTESLIDVQTGVVIDTSDIPVLQDIEPLDVFAGLTLGHRSYTYLEEDYSKLLFGVVIGGLYAINDQWAVGAKLSTMTQDPRFVVRYSF